ncbi:Uncharacterised protein [uncultured archaeon]|nr:Uncharacterised protein [uncultured archaeon]
MTIPCVPSVVYLAFTTSNPPVLVNAVPISCWLPQLLPFHTQPLASLPVESNAPRIITSLELRGLRSRLTHEYCISVPMELSFMQFAAVSALKSLLDSGSTLYPKSHAPLVLTTP